MGWDRIKGDGWRSRALVVCCACRDLLMFFSLTRLEADGGLEDDEEDEREDGVVPVLVQAPEQDAQDLEDEEGCHRVLLQACVGGGDGGVS